MTKQISNEQLLQGAYQPGTNITLDQEKEHDNGLDTHGESPKTTSPERH